MSEGPKLYTNKPKKGKTQKQFFAVKKQSFILLFFFFFLFSVFWVSVFDFWLIVCALLLYKQTAQLKKFQEGHQKAKEFSTPSSSSSTMGTQSSSAPPPQPPPPKESFARRYKFVWPMLLAVNLAVGGSFLSLIPQSSVYVCMWVWVFICLQSDWIYKMV